MSEPLLNAPMGAAGRRRSAVRSRRPGPLVALALVVPLLTAGAVALTDDPIESIPAQAPRTVQLDRTTMTCPGEGPIVVANADLTRSGEVVVGNGAPERLPAGALLQRTPARGQRPVVVGRGADIAPGLVAVRDSANGLECRGLEPTNWFTGAGAGPEHQSTVWLSNPDNGVAVADVTVLGPRGVVSVDALRGVAVPARSTVGYNLAEVVPSLDTLGVGVTINRGRLGTWISDRYRDVGSRQSAERESWGQSEVSETSYLMGLAQPGRGATTTVTVTNPGEDAAVVELALVTARSEFTPKGRDAIRLPASSTVDVDLSTDLRGTNGEGVIGVKVQSSTPLVAAATMRLSPGRPGSSVLRVAAQPAVSHSAVVLPKPLAGRPGLELVLGGVTQAGTVRADFRTADGKALPGQALDLRPRAGAAISVPKRARVVVLTAKQTRVVGAIRVAGQGAVISLTQLVETGQVPQIRPALN